MFLKNYWYVAARIEEIGRTPLARTILSEPIVLFRREDGTPVALQDRCIHRSLPLFEGTVVGETLECGYHGLRFDCTGACIADGTSVDPAGAASSGLAAGGGQGL